MESNNKIPAGKKKLIKKDHFCGYQKWGKERREIGELFSKWVSFKLKN